MDQAQSKQAALRGYQFYNRLFWLGVLGIFLFPVAAMVVAMVAFQITKNSNISAPIALSGPFWSVAGLAIALLVRGARKRAWRSVDLAHVAEALHLEFAMKASNSVMELLKSISFMQNPTSAKGRNVLASTDKNVPHFALDYFYAYDYGAVSFEADESLVVFPDLVPHLPDLFVFPMGLGDRLLSQFFGAFQQIKVPASPEFPRHFHLGSIDPAAAERMITVPLLQVFHQNPNLSLVIENGTLIVFYQLQQVSPKAYAQFLSAAHRLAQAVCSVR
ncbi:MAG: hypothetical protein JNL58_15605 [Planctomyces sp.]|nr:hypothetical protein [Planctomyces sp.]